MTKGNEPRYHVALSYAGEDREYVAKVAVALAELGVRYFYDQEAQVELWGTHLNESLERIYLNDSASVLIFISEWYAVKTWPTQERRMALIRAMEDPESILSARFDDTRVPGILPDVVTMSANDTPPEMLAQRVAEKLALRGVLAPASAKPVTKVALPEELTYLLTMLKPAISQFTYQHDRFQGPSLAAMHVRQSVTDHAVRKPVEDLFDDDRLFQESRMLTGLAQPFEDVLDRHDHLVIEGAAGQGKTTLGRHLALELTRALLEPESAPRKVPTAIPLMLPARVLANYISRMTWEDALLAATMEEYGNHVTGRMSADLFTRRQAGLPWLIIVDALDEIPEVHLCDKLLAVLAGRIALPDNPESFLITSRPLVRGQIALLGGGQATGFYQLEPFDEEGLRRLAFKWFARDRGGVQTAEDFLSQVQEAGLGEVLRVPLLASIAADVFGANQDRRLPASRYELYEQCIPQLANRREVRRSDVLTAFAATTNGPELARWLEGDGGDLLLEKLASAYTTGQTTLRTVLRSALPMPVSPEDEGNVEQWLSCTGLLNLAGGRLRFQHQTFAEHLHANSRARSLPPFQPDAPEWEDLIRGVLLGKDDDERVLLHYLHRYNRDEGAVLTWLQQGTRAQCQAACSLIIGGAPFLDAHLSTFLETVARAINGDVMAHGELTAMAALTRYRPVAAELMRLLNDDLVAVDYKIAIADVLRNTPDGRRMCPPHLEELITRAKPTYVRLPAAEVLARFGSEYSERAAAVLVDLSNDPAANVFERLQAAGALLKMGDTHRLVAIDAFRSVIVAPGEPLSVRVQPAVELAKIAEYRAEAAGALLDMARLAGEDDDARLTALKELAKLGAEHRRAAGELLRQLAGDPDVSRSERAFVFAELAGVDRAYRRQAADKLVALALDGTANGYDRVAACEELLSLGSEYRERVAEGYLAVLEDSTAEVFDRWAAAESLIKLGGEFVAAAARAWRKLATDPQIVGSSRYSIHFELAALDADYQPEAARALAEFAADPGEPGDRRRAATSALAKLGAGYVVKAIEIFVRQLDDPDSSPVERLLAGMVLVDLRPDTEDVVAASLFQLASMPTASAEVRLGVAGAMAELGQLRPSRRRLLRELSQDHSVNPSSRISITEQLVQLGGETRDEALQTLVGLISDPAVPLHSRVDVARVLGVESQNHRSLAVRTLLDLTTLSITAHETRTKAAEALSVLDENMHREASRVYVAVATDERAALTARLDAVGMLTCLGAEHRTEAVELLRGMAADQGLSHPGRCAVANSLAGMGQEQLAEATNLLVSLAEDREASIEGRRAAVSGLVSLGPVCYRLAADLLEQLVAQLEPLDVEHALVLLDLARLDPSRRLSALEALHHIASSQQAHVADRRMALRSLLELNGDVAGRLGSVLGELADDPAWDSADRVNLGIRMAVLDPAHHKKALVIFRGVASDPTAVVGTRLQAAEWLGKLGNTDAAEASVRALALDSGLRMPDRRTAANALGRHCGSPAPVISLLTEIATAEENGTYSRRMAAQDLIGKGPQGLAAAADLLGTLARDTGCGWNRYLASLALIDLGGSARSTAAEVLKTLGEAPDTRPLVAAFATCELARLDGAYHLRAVAALTSVRTSGVERMQAASALRRLSRYHHHLASEVMREVAEDGSLRCWERRLAATELATTGPRGLAAAKQTLADLVHDERADPWERAEACHVLATLDEHRRDRLVPVFRELGGETTPMEQRVRALELFAAFGPEGRAEATAAFRKIASDSGAAPAARVRACEASWWLRDVDGVDVRALLEICEDEDAVASDRRVAAVLLARFQEKGKMTAIAVLRRLVNVGTSVDQALSRHELAKMNAGDWSIAAAALHHHRELLDPSERWLLARACAECDFDSRWATVEPLHQAVCANSSAADRLRAVTDLEHVLNADSVVELDQLNPDNFGYQRSSWLPNRMY
ncbi:TIR domain-containing protein [Lentzea sp. NPDC051838]|uniref:TIR domain-containing protein n=1 Tax=Lentzea sp. NPDC051838 TaxID=3154849 RepID=UPI00341D2A25